MANSTTYNILNSLTRAAKTTGVEHIFVTNRPKVYDTKMGNFVVVMLPGRQTRPVKGNDDFIVRTAGVFNIAMPEKQNGTPNIKAQTDLVQKFMDLFPISDDYITASNPEIIMRGDDDTGFQVTSIMFDVRTKINSFKK